VLALGKNSPIFPFLFEHVPTFDLFQAPTRWNVILVFSLSLLASIGADFWERQQLLRLFWVRLGTVGAAAAAIVALIAGILLSDIEPSLVPAVASAGGALFVIGTLAWRRRLKPGKAWMVLFSAVILADLLWAGSGLNPSQPLSLYKEKSELYEKAGNGHRVYMPSDLEYAFKFETSHRFDTFLPGIEWPLVRDVGLPNTPLLDRIPSANNFDPILPRHFVQWMNRLDEVKWDHLPTLLELMDVGWRAVVDPAAPGGINYLRVDDPQRIRIISAATWVPNDERALNEVFKVDFNPRSEVILQGAPGLQTENGSGAFAFRLLRQDNPNLVQIEVSLEKDRWLVLSDVWFPGWQALIDGEEAGIYRANYAFRAVYVPAGEHFVEFRYSPPSFQMGLAFSILSWAAMGYLAWVRRRSS
jgi:hypothetical protein